MQAEQPAADDKETHLVLGVLVFFKELGAEFCLIWMIAGHAEGVDCDVAALSH